MDKKEKLAGADYSLSAANSNILYIVRIIAAEIVLVGHLFSFLQLTLFKNQEWFPYIQSLAVLVFFLLSGFLTDYSLQRKGDEYTYKRYLKDHFKRIYMFYFPSLILILLIDLLNIYLNPSLYDYYSTFNVITFLKNVFMFPFGHQPFGSGRPLWTLYIEWWLYIGYGFYVLVFSKKCRSCGLKLWHIILFAALLIPFSGKNIITILAFLIGVAINRVYKKISFNSKLAVVFAFIVFIICSMYLKDAYHLVELGLVSLLLIQILVLGNKAESRIGKGFRNKLKWISGFTYPLYLIHYSLIELIINRTSLGSNITKFFISFVISNICAVLLYWSVTFGAKLLENRKKNKIAN